VEPELDLTRLAELQELLGTEMKDLVATLVNELTRAMAQMTAALAAGDLDGVAHAAHDARNSALMIDAGPLLSRLSEVESGARADDMARTVAGHAAVAEAWPSLRGRLQAAAG
jgi:HPt (histidine-containing phosphotransfer) domain-containing protein